VCTNNGTTTIYDIETKQKLMTLRPRMSNQYLKNRATFDPYDELILSDGVLWDFKSGKEVHKFDKLNENLSGVFNPRSGLEIIANTEIWDVRTFHLLKTVRQLDQCLLKFTNDGSVIYGVKIEREEHPSGDGTISFRYSDTSFVVVDNLDDYSSIATIELKRYVFLEIVLSKLPFNILG
jgi:HIV-1 Vpr-binding protein